MKRLAIIAACGVLAWLAPTQLAGAQPGPGGGPSQQASGGHSASNDDADTAESRSGRSSDHERGGSDSSDSHEDRSGRSSDHERGGSDIREDRSGRSSDHERGSEHSGRGH